MKKALATMDKINMRASENRSWLKEIKHLKIEHLPENGGCQHKIYFIMFSRVKEILVGMDLFKTEHRCRGTFTRGGAMTRILPTNSKVYVNFTY